MLTNGSTTITNEIRERPRCISCRTAEERRIKNLKFRVENGKNLKDHD
jgi:hypothetical protein